jgi:hypothetical protein
VDAIETLTYDVASEILQREAESPGSQPSFSLKISEAILLEVRFAAHLGTRASVSGKQPA